MFSAHKDIVEAESNFLSQIPSVWPAIDFLLIQTTTTTTTTTTTSRTPSLLIVTNPCHHCHLQHFLLCQNSKQSLKRNFSSNQTTTTIITPVKVLTAINMHMRELLFPSSGKLSLCPDAINVGEQFAGFKRITMHPIEVLIIHCILYRAIWWF